MIEVTFRAKNQHSLTKQLVDYLGMHQGVWGPEYEMDFMLTQGVGSNAERFVGCCGNIEFVNFDGERAIRFQFAGYPFTGYLQVGEDGNPQIQVVADNPDIDAVMLVDTQEDVKCNSKNEYRVYDFKFLPGQGVGQKIDTRGGE